MRFILITALIPLLLISVSLAADGDNAQEDLGMFDLPFEQVMNIKVISVTRDKGQDVFTSPAAIYVITQEDIRRSGLDSLPELLRLAPGVHVARVSASIWSISIRGLSSRFNNRTLVMVDGRSIFTPSFGGVYWDIQDIPLEIIERVEVVRGSGGTLWGSNAVNGVINIITKNAEDTQGGTVIIGGGSEHLAKTTGIYGGKAGENGYYRVYGKWDLYDDFNFKDGSDARDQWNLGKGGYRFDWKEGADCFTLEGGFYHSHLGFRAVANNPIQTRTSVYGNHILGKWQRQLEEDSTVHFQFYYDMTDRISGEVDEQRHTGDIELVHSFVPVDGHKMTWGLRYNVYNDERRATFLTNWTDPIMTKQTYSGFVQDSFDIVPDLLKLTLGTKMERNQFTGFEFQPSTQLVYTPSEKHVYWAAASRSVRNPMIVDDDIIFAGGVLGPNKDIDSEVLQSLELGYRYSPSNRFYLDVSAYSNFYDGLIFDNFDNMRDNVHDARVNGVEVATSWQANEKWRLLGSYSFNRFSVRNADKSIFGDFHENAYPKNMASLRSYMDITDKLELNSAFYYTDNTSAWPAKSLARLDVGLTYKASKSLEFSVWGQNLLEPQDREMLTTSGPDIAEAQRAVFAKMTYKF